MTLFHTHSERRVLRAVRCTLKIEYTVLRVRKPCSSGIGCAARTPACERGTKWTSWPSDQRITLVSRGSARYALTCVGNNETCSRPSIDLRRNPGAHVHQRRFGVMTALPKATHEKRQYPQSPGMRGKCGELSDTSTITPTIGTTAPGNRRLMYADTPFPGAADSFQDYNCGNAVCDKNGGYK